MPMKWLAIMLACIFSALAATDVAKEIGKTNRYEACVRHHAPSACKGTD